MKLSFSFLIALATAAVSAQAPQMVAQKLTVDYQTAIKGQDFSAFERILAPDFAYLDAKGRKITKAAFLKKFEGLYRGMALQTFRVDASSARKGRGGILFVQDTKVLGVSTLGGSKANFFTADSRDEVLAVRRGGKWLVKQVKSERRTTTMNGKPFQAI